MTYGNSMILFTLSTPSYIATWRIGCSIPSPAFSASTAS